MTQKITRRQLLKYILAATATARLAPLLHARARYPGVAAASLPQRADDWVWMGRAIHTVTFYEEPTTSSERLVTRARDESFHILEEVRAPYSAHNDLWYRTVLGYVHSAWVQPLRIYAPQSFIRDVGAWGFWGEVSQPYTEARVAPSLQAARQYRFYGNTVFRVLESFEDEAGTGWYKVADDYPPRSQGNHQWVLARDMRRIPRTELSPIHPFAGDKRIAINLTAQTLTCYENEDPIYHTLIASGRGGNLETPTGDMCVLLKQPSRHMSNVPYPDWPEDVPIPAPEDIFDLPGVPWVIFFDLIGSAIHGAYWHNDFGIRRSSGCVNVPCDVARWIYRWCYPIAGYEDDFVQSTCRVGTPISISY